MPPGNKRKKQLDDARPGKEPFSEAQVNEILEKGYTVYTYGKAGRYYMDQPSIATYKSKCRKLSEGSVPIFNNGDVERGIEDDGTRRQLPVPMNKFPVKVSVDVVDRLALTFPDLKPEKTSLIYSYDNGHDQRPHTDITCGDECLKDPMVALMRHNMLENRLRTPLSVLMTVEDDARVRVWPGSHQIVWMSDDEVDRRNVDFIKSILVSIPPYSVMIFRQDLVHAGCKYEDRDRLRGFLFANLKRRGYKRPKDEIQYHDETFYLVGE